MSPRLLVRSCCIALLVLGAATARAELRDRPVLELDRALHLTAPGGDDLLLPRGSYRVEAERTGLLRLVPEAGGEGDAVLVDAESIRHQEEIPSAVVLSIPGEEEDLHYLVLLLPDGSGLEAVGCHTEMRSRGPAPRLTRLRLAEAMRAWRKSRPQRSRIPDAAAARVQAERKPATSAPRPPAAAAPGLSRRDLHRLVETTRQGLPPSGLHPRQRERLGEIVGLYRSGKKTEARAEWGRWSSTIEQNDPGLVAAALHHVVYRSFIEPHVALDRALVQLRNAEDRVAALEREAGVSRRDVSERGTLARIDEPKDIQAPARPGAGGGTGGVAKPDRVALGSSGLAAARRELARSENRVFALLAGATLDPASDPQTQNDLYEAVDALRDAEMRAAELERLRLRCEAGDPVACAEYAALLAQGR